MQYIFVYGTLRKGFGLHTVIEDCPFIGYAKTDNDYTLIEGTNFPFLVEREGDGAIGEVYSIPEFLIPELDRIEGHPFFYERKKIIVKLDNEKDVEVSTYIHPDNLPESFNIITDFTKERF